MEVFSGFWDFLAEAKFVWCAVRDARAVARPRWDFRVASQPMVGVGFVFPATQRPDDAAARRHIKTQTLIQFLPY